MILALTSLTSCWATGPYFQPIEHGKDQAVIYVYRLSGQIGAGNFYDIYANDRVITTLYSGGYYPHVTEPGHVVLKASPGASERQKVNLDVEAGQTYFVKFYMQEGPGLVYTGASPRLKRVLPREGLSEIKDCRLVKGAEG
jgi:hypothetical protein